MKKYDLAIIGKQFPVGGVTVHVNRLLQTLEERMMNFCFIQLNFGAMLKSFVVLRKTEVAHIHTSNPFVRMFFAIVCRLCFCRSILTIHGNLGRFGLVKNLFDYTSILIADVVIVLNIQSYDKALKFNRRVFLVPAFLPPIKEKLLQKSIVSHLELLRMKYRHLFSTCAWNLMFDHNGSEIYGIIDLIEIFRSIDMDCLIVSDPSGKYNAYFQKKGGAPKNVFFITEAHSYFELLKRVDVFIRSTTTDGDSLSVKEALFLNKKVIASNCVSRPANVVLYETSDITDLEQKLLETDLNENHQKNEVVSGIDKLLAIYKLLI